MSVVGAANLFDAIDGNQSQSGIISRQAATNDAGTQLFDMIDANGDGVISRAEWNQLMQGNVGVRREAAAVYNQYQQGAQVGFNLQPVMSYNVSQPMMAQGNVTYGAPGATITSAGFGAAQPMVSQETTFASVAYGGVASGGITYGAPGAVNYSISSEAASTGGISYGAPGAATGGISYGAPGAVNYSISPEGAATGGISYGAPGAVNYNISTEGAATGGISYGVPGAVNYGISSEGAAAGGISYGAPSAVNYSISTEGAAAGGTSYGAPGAVNYSISAEGASAGTVVYGVPPPINYGVSAEGGAGQTVISQQYSGYGVSADGASAGAVLYGAAPAAVNYSVPAEATAGQAVVSQQYSGYGVSADGASAGAVLYGAAPATVNYGVSAENLAGQTFVSQQYTGSAAMTYSGVAYTAAAPTINYEATAQPVGQDTVVTYAAPEAPPTVAVTEPIPYGMSGGSASIPGAVTYSVPPAVGGIAYGTPAEIPGGGVTYGTVSGGSVTYTLPPETGPYISVGDAMATFDAPTDSGILGAPAVTYGAPPAVDAAMPGGVQMSYGTGAVYSGGQMAQATFASQPYSTQEGGVTYQMPGMVGQTFEMNVQGQVSGQPQVQGTIYETNLQGEPAAQTMYVQGDAPAQTMFVQGDIGMQMQPPEMVSQNVTYGAPIQAQYEVPAPGQTMEVGGQVYAGQGQNITYGISGQVEVGQQTVTYGAPPVQYVVQPGESGSGGGGFVTYSAPPQPEMQGQVTYTTPEMQGQVAYTTQEMQGQVTYTTQEMQGQVTYTTPEMQGQVTYSTPEMQGQFTYTTPPSVVAGPVGIGGPSIQQGQIGEPLTVVQGQEFTSSIGQGGITVGGPTGFGGQSIQQGQISGSYQGQIVGGQASMPGQVIQGIPQGTISYTQGSSAVTQGLSYQIPGQTTYAANAGYQLAGQTGYVYGGAQAPSPMGYTQYSTMMQTGAGVQASTSYTPPGQIMQVQGQTSSSYTPPANYTYGAPSAEVTYAAPQAAPADIVVAQPVQTQNGGLQAAESMLCYSSGPQASEGQEKVSTGAKKGKVTKEGKKKKTGGCC